MTDPDARHAPANRGTSPASGPPTRPRTDAGGGSLLRAGTIMMLLALLLSWLPLIGPLVAGVVGGREAGTPPRALGVAILPAVLLAVFIGWALTAFDLPIVGAIAGIGVFIAMVVQLAPMLLGAWFGGSTRTAGPAAR